MASNIKTATYKTVKYFAKVQLKNRKYQMIPKWYSFDVTSLFADVSLDETNKFTPHIICIDKEEINTTFPKSEMNDL